jgi:acetyltransferase
MNIKLTSAEKQFQREPAHDFLKSQPGPLDALLKPESVAVIGATDREGSVGRDIVLNLTKDFKGKLYAINPKRSEVLGVKAYPRIQDCPEAPELSIIITPATTVPGLIGDCVDKGVKSSIVISAGFKERGPEGAALETQILQRIKGTGFRIVGPNCLGLMSPHIGLNASFATHMALPGSVAFLSQSGALGTAILEWSISAKVGLSSFISVGSMLDVNWGDMISALGNDPYTRCILIYMETIGNAQAFLSAAREVAYSKPIIILKTGRSEVAAKAAISHTGSLAGSDKVLRAAFTRCGVLWVDQIEDLFYMAETLAKQPRPKGNRLTIVTNAGGPGVLATDALVEGQGVMAEVDEPTLKALNDFLPPSWSHGNPVDVLGDADPDRYVKSMDLAIKNSGSDALLAIVTPQSVTQPTVLAEKLKGFGKDSGKPVLTCLMGGDEMSRMRELLSESGIPSFAYPDTAVRVFNHMWHYSSNLRRLYETPAATDEDQNVNAQKNVAGILAKVHASGRTLLTEFESKQLLSEYGIPSTKTLWAKTPEEAVKAAEEIKYPVVLKLNSETITHKSDVGGVVLNLQNASDVQGAFNKIKAAITEKVGAEHFQGVTVQPMIKLDGFELILGCSPDAQFGPVILFGMGGTLVEVFKDSSLALPPLTTTLARRMMEKTTIYKAFKGVRGKPPVDLALLEKIMVRFSRLIVEQPAIREIDLNPLVAAGNQVIALDARVVLNDPKTDKSTWPKPVIRPYPSQYISQFKLKDGTALTLRPIRPEDEPLMVEFHHSLSDFSVYMRYFAPVKLTERTAHDRLVRLCFIDYLKEMAIVADYRDPQGTHHIIGVGRLSQKINDLEKEFAIVVSDDRQHQGLGYELLHRLVEIGRSEGFKKIVGYMLSENTSMQQMSKKLGFEVRYSEDHKSVEASYNY